MYLEISQEFLSGNCKCWSNLRALTTVSLYIYIFVFVDKGASGCKKVSFGGGGSFHKKMKVVKHFLSKRVFRARSNVV